MTTDFVWDALEQALFEHLPGQKSALIHHSDRGSQYLSVRYSERLSEAGIPGVGGQQQLLQHAGRDDQRAVQGRADPLARLGRRARRWRLPRSNGCRG
jgi:transposase InsO family protein